MVETDDAPTRPATLSTLQLGWVFLSLGTVAFGGLGASLALIHRELVDRRRVLTPETLTEALTFTKPLPGSTIVQVVAYLGFRLGGWRGSALAAAAFLTPPFLGMVLMAGLFGIVRDQPGVSSSIKGLAAAVVGLMTSTTLRLGRSNVKGLLTLTIALAAFAAAVRFQVNAALIVVVSGLLGLLTLIPGRKAGGE